MGVIAAAAIAAVAAGGSAYMASQSAKKAQDKNQKAAKATNDLNLRMFQESRGSQGSAFMPTYAENSAGGLFEPEFFANSRNVYEAAGSASPAGQMQAYQDALVDSTTAQKAAMGTIGDLYSGKMEEGIQQGFAPAQQARLGGVEARRQGTLEALQQTLNQIKTTQARRGFAGDSLAKHHLDFSARRGANTAYATDLAGAQEVNAMEKARIKQGFAQTQLGSVNMPYGAARNMVSTMNLPADAILDQEGRRNQLMKGTFGIGTNQFNYSPLPQVQPIAGAAQIGLQALSSGASAYGGYLAQGKLAGELGGGGTPPPSGGGSAGPWAPGGTYDQGADRLLAARDNFYG